MNAQVKISSLYQAHTHDLEQQVKELQNLVRDLEDGLERLSESRDEAVTALKEQTEAFQTEIEQKELKIEELSAQVKSINAAGMSEMRKLPLGLELLSPAAQAASQFQKSGKTFTEIYAEYTKLQDENLLANQEIVRLTECLNHILGELAERPDPSAVQRG
ncbi:hypothetical protein BC829DRAFT_269582 [Chytridium lagenaria]|nr:hypothetical protein BC829DRAFT_269582 [Chytridium lagenaria]